MMGNAMQLTTSQAVPSTFNFRAYLINNDSIVLVGVDSQHVVIGTAIRQR